MRLDDDDALAFGEDVALGIYPRHIFTSVMVELSVGKKISRILASTVEILRHRRNAAEEGYENRHRMEAKTEEENEMAEPTVAFAKKDLIRSDSKNLEREISDWI